MTKEEAIIAMKSDIKVTHKFFALDEWVTMEGDLVVIDESGFSYSTREFWRDRTSDDWNSDWSIW